MWVVFVAVARRNAFGGCVAVCRDERAGETIGVSRTLWSPPQWAEQVVIYDRAVEIRCLKVL